MKFLNEALDKVFTRLGKSNDSEIVTATLAAFKLIFIPISTMSDKKTSKEQKEYAIKRDILTESVALAGYIGITKALKNNLTAPICKKYYSTKAKKLVKEGKLDINSADYNILSNVNAKDIKASAMSSLLGEGLKSLDDNQKENIKKLEGVVEKFGDFLQKPNDLYLNSKKILSHLCVCTLALTLIPFITNKILGVMAKNKNKNENLDIQAPKPIVTTPIKTPSFKQYSQMTKIGGPICL